MAGRRRWAAVGAVIMTVAACGDADLGSRAPACDALMQLAERSAACDPALEPLVAELAKEPNEVACRIAARRVLAGPREHPPRVRSVWTPASAPNVTPLSIDELAALTTPALPAQLVVIPDIPPGPGVPPTSAEIDDASLDVDERGRLHIHRPPGPSTLLLRHAGRESTYCIELDPCETLRVTAHGDKLARNPSVRSGPC